MTQNLASARLDGLLCYALIMLAPWLVVVSQCQSLNLITVSHIGVQMSRTILSYDYGALFPY